MGMRFVLLSSPQQWDLTDAFFIGQLIKAVAAVNNNTIVVMHIPGPVVVEEWINHPNVGMAEILSSRVC